MNNIDIYDKVDDKFITEVIDKIICNKKVHRRIKGNGILHIDRQLPFLTVLRLNENEHDLETSKLLKAEPSFFIIPYKISKSKTKMLIDKISETLSNIFGGFLIIELWAGNTSNKKKSQKKSVASPTPKFKIHADTNGLLISSCERLYESFKKIKVHKNKSEVILDYKRNTRPRNKSPLLLKTKQQKINCHSIGIEVFPIYQNNITNEFYPYIFKVIHKGITNSLRQVYFEFSKNISNLSPVHYHSLGSNAINKITYKVDSQISMCCSQIDFLLWVTPTNTEENWKKFKKSKYEKEPIFHYNPLPLDPFKIKRTLYDIEIDKIHDPTLHDIYHEKRIELEKQLSMLHERNSPNFLLSSMQLYGKTSNSLFNLAKKIALQIEKEKVDESFSGKHDSSDFKKLAEKEISFYNKLTNNKLNAKVITTPNISSLMVSNGNLYIGESIKIPKNREQALLHHEIGTHIITYFNGGMQSLKLFSYGLPGYDELQEGLAVLAEYLVGQLSNSRIKLLAGRVIAAKLIEDGYSFIEVFNELNLTYNFEEKTAYRITTRIFRGGGLTKDAIYLRGFNNLLKYLKFNDINTLFIGKFANTHTSLVNELIYRKILNEPYILPRYLQMPKVQKRLSKIKNGLTILDMLEN